LASVPRGGAEDAQPVLRQRRDPPPRVRRRVVGRGAGEPRGPWLPLGIEAADEEDELSSRPRADGALAGRERRAGQGAVGAGGGVERRAARRRVAAAAAAPADRPVS